jgi:hypothetical protein
MEASSMEDTGDSILTSVAARKLAQHGLRVEDVLLVVRRLREGLPHLQFSAWTAVESTLTEATVQESQGKLACHIPVGGLDLSSSVRSALGRVTKADDAILRDMTGEARQLLAVSGRAGTYLADFGLPGLSRALARLLRRPAAWPVVSDTLRNVRALASETYEDHRIPFGLILTTHTGDADAPLSFESKRVKALTDGFSTALLVNLAGGLAGIIALPGSREAGRSNLHRPWWLSPLADSAARVGGVGVALTRAGDVLVAHGREMIASHRSGHWMVWRHSQLLALIRRSWHTGGRGDALDRVIAAAYRVALELSTRRSGGLLVIASSRDGAKKLVASRRDLLGARGRLPGERWLDASLEGVPVHHMDRRIVADLASIDGALILDRTGRMLAFGAMVRSSTSNSTQGARSRAAVAASRRGLALKVSSDGAISVYRHGGLVLDL